MHYFADHYRERSPRSLSLLKVGHRMLREHDKSEDPFMIVAGGSSQGASALSDLGCEREFNEDRCGLVQSSNNKTWIVCDGMGGVAGGEVAAQLAIDAMKRYLERDSQEEASADILVQAMREANRVVVLRRQNQAFSAMGTTMVAAFFNRDEVVIGHVGDSRAYLIRDGAVQQITVDHTYVQSLVERGEIQAEEALTHPEAHVLTRCIGADPSLEVDTQRFWLWPNEHADESDILLLCTDGLYSLVPDVEIGQVASTMSPQEACEKLIDLARARGGYDNITVAIVPLVGQLKQSPHPNGGDLKERAKSAPVQRSGVKLGFAKQLLLLAVMSGIAALATVVGFLAMKFFR